MYQHESAIDIHMSPSSCTPLPPPTPSYPSAFAAAKSLQSCPTLCNPTDGSPPGSPVPGVLQARILEWVAISFSGACMHAKPLQSCLTLHDPMDSSPPGSSVHRILQARIPEWVAISFSTHSSRLSQNPSLSRLSHTANSHGLSVLHTVIYVFPCYSLYFSHPILWTFEQVCYLCLGLHFCPINRFISPIFLD